MMKKEKKIAVYTSCAVNYLAKATALLESIRVNSPNTTLTLILCDVLPSDFDPPPFDRIWTPIDLGYNEQWIFKHDIMELCTAVKGRGLKRLMETEKDAEIFVYLDPDVFVYSDLHLLYEELGSASIGLVPHITSPEETDLGVQLTELSVLQHGTYNLGHLIIRNSEIGKNFASWWADRLDRYCYDDRSRGLFTDQRWIDLVPAIFSDVNIIRSNVIDVASWNIYGKNINEKYENGVWNYYINGKLLVTYHFSGTGNTGTHFRIRNAFAPTNGTLAKIEREYEECISKHSQETLQQFKPAYDFYRNGRIISTSARRFYRENRDLQEHYKDPYGDSYEAWLSENKPNLTTNIKIREDRLLSAFNDLFDENWYRTNYPDVKQGIRHGLWKNGRQHYIEIGSSLLYDPNKYFFSASYFSRAEKLKSINLYSKSRSEASTILGHYLTEGLHNGVEPNEYFNSKWYISQYEDVRLAFEAGKISSPLAHFLHFGDLERRQPGPSFEPTIFIGSVDHDSSEGLLSKFFRIKGMRRAI